MNVRFPFARSAGWLLAAALSGSLAPDVRATTTSRLSLQEMVEASDTIVIGRAVGAESVWVGKTLYTRYRVAVDETLHGDAGIEVAVVVPGGIDTTRTHPIAVVVPDAPVMQRDEPVALLLARSNALPGGAFAIVGFNQGRIRLAAANTAPTAPQATLRAATPDANAQAVRVNRMRTKLQELVAARGQPAAMRAPETRAATGVRPARDFGARRLP